MAGVNVWKIENITNVLNIEKYNNTAMTVLVVRCTGG